MIVDLSQEISPEMQVYPGYPSATIVPWNKHDTHGFVTEAIFHITHIGTHVDAPFHFDPTGMKVHQIPPAKLIADGLVLNLTHKGPKDLITVRDVEKAEEAARRPMQTGDIVLLQTGWEEHLGKPEYISSYPGISRECAEYLVSKKIGAVGLDTPSADHPDDVAFPAHKTLLSNGVLIIENLVNLSRIGVRRFKFIGLPLKIHNSSGSPIRAVALIE